MYYSTASYPPAEHTGRAARKGARCVTARPQNDRPGGSRPRPAGSTRALAIAVAAPFVAAVISVLFAGNHNLHFLAPLAPTVAVLVVFVCLARLRHHAR